MAQPRTQEEIRQFNEEVRLRRLDDLDHDDRTRANNTSVGTHSASHKFSDAIPIFDKIIREEADPNGDDISALERMRMFQEEPMMRAAGANLNYDLVEKLYMEAAPLYRNLKRVVLRDQGLGGSAAKLRAPNLEFPKLVISTGDSPEDTIAYYKWKTAAVHTRDTNSCTMAALVQLALNSMQVPDRIKQRVGLCYNLDSMFTELEQILPSRAHAGDHVKRQLEAIVDEAIGKEGRVSAQDTISNADRILDLIYANKCLDAHLDLSYGQVMEIVGVFSVEYAGSIEQRQSMVDTWLVTNKAEIGSLLAHALTKWLEQLRNSALTIRSRREDPRRAKVEELTKEIKQLKQDAEKRQRKVQEGRRTENAQPKRTPPRQVTFDCRYCGKNHRVMECPEVAAARVSNAPLPLDMCPYCLGKKTIGQHAKDDQKGCHIKPASSRQKRMHDNENLKRDELCRETEVSVYACHHCFTGTDNGKRPNQMGSPRYLTGHRLAVLGHPKFELLNHYYRDPFVKVIHSPEERIEVWNPEGKEWIKGNILYDTGSTVSIAEVGLTAYSVAPPVTRITSLTTPNEWACHVCFHSVIKIRSPQNPHTTNRLLVDIPVVCVDLPIF